MPARCCGIIYQCDITLIDALERPGTATTGVIQMYALKDNTTPSQSEPMADQTHPAASNLARKWAHGRRQITPWAYPHLRALAAIRLAVGLFLVGLGATFLAQSHDGYAAIALAGAALTLSIGVMDGTAARSARPRG
jgi:hypothetical protein